MTDKAEVLWRMYNEHCTHGRHHETQRSGMTSIILVIAGALFTFLGQGVLSHSKWSLAACLIVLGVFGAVFSVKQYERARRHMTIAGKHRRALEAEVGVDLVAIKEAGDAAHKSNFPSISRVGLNELWTAIHLLIAAAGVILLFITLTK